MNIDIFLSELLWWRQIFAMPVFDMLETVLVKKMNFDPSFKLRFITRSLYVGKSHVFFILYI